MYYTSPNPIAAVQCNNVIMRCRIMFCVVRGRLGLCGGETRVESAHFEKTRVVRNAKPRTKTMPNNAQAHTGEGIMHLQC